LHSKTTHFTTADSVIKTINTVQNVFIYCFLYININTCGEHSRYNATNIQYEQVLTITKMKFINNCIIQYMSFGLISFFLLHIAISQFTCIIFFYFFKHYPKLFDCLIFDLQLWPLPLADTWATCQFCTSPCWGEHLSQIWRKSFN
jgi:hypothetical protein